MTVACDKLSTTFHVHNVCVKKEKDRYMGFISLKQVIQTAGMLLAG